VVAHCAALGYFDVHGARLVAGFAVYASRSDPLDAEYAEQVEDALKGAVGASILAERPFDEKRQSDRSDKS